MEATFLRYLLATYLAAAFVAAIFYLRHRRVTLLEFLVWGAVALALPVLGPFFVIAARPGPRKRQRGAGAKKRRD
jgi:4-amino-4-deoxy-L-arabinose transferase-like glycosyltransferase